MHLTVCTVAVRCLLRDDASPCRQRQARLSRPQGQDLGLLHAVSALGATGGHDSGSLDQQGPGSSQTAAAAAAGADGWVSYPAC